MAKSEVFVRWDELFKKMVRIRDLKKKEEGRIKRKQIRVYNIAVRKMRVREEEKKRHNPQFFLKKINPKQAIRKMGGEEKKKHSGEEKKKKGTTQHHFELFFLIQNDFVL